MTTSMSDTHTQIVKRVVQSLAADEDRETALVRYLEHDRDILVDSIVETLRATRDEITEQQAEERLEREILNDLRWRPTVRGPARLAAWFWVSRRPLGFLAGLAVLTLVVTMLLV